MLPAALETLLRAIGLVVAVSLAVLPWLVTLNVNDPFINQSWALFGLALVCFICFALLKPFYQPRRSQFPLLTPGLLAWLAIAGATLHSSYLVSLRTGLLWGSLLLILFGLRTTLRGRDASPMLLLVSISGSLMAVYALIQASGHDLLEWPGSPYRVVGTFSNPQYLSAYLMSTVLVTVGLAIDPRLWSPAKRISLGILALLQIAGMAAAATTSCWLGMAVVIGLYSTAFWEIRPGRLLRSTPLMAGSIVTFLFLGLYGAVSAGVWSYPWAALIQPPIENFSTVTRLFEWAMGFRLFLQYPLIGIGPGATQYLLSAFRPPLGMVFGLSRFNDDPHAWPIQILSETGMGGLFAACSLVAAVIGVHAWRRHHSSSEEADELHAGSLIPAGQAAPARPGISLARAALVPAVSLLFYGLFNNALAVTPLVTQTVLLIGLHQALCLREVRWHKLFSVSGFAYALLIPAFAASAWLGQSSHQEVERNLFSGILSLDAGKPDAAETSFQAALRANPQSLQALWGLALSSERLGRPQRTMELLSRLDTLSPNAFAGKFEIARIAFDRHLLLEAHKMALLHLSGNLSPLGHEVLGRILLAEGRRSEAAETFREGLRFIPSWQTPEVEAAGRIRLHLAELETESGNWKEASLLLSQLPPDLASTPNVHYLRGLALYRTGNISSALAMFEKALEIDNASDPKYLNAVGFMLGETGGDLERAQTLLEEAYRQYRSRQPPLLADILQVAHSLGMVAWKQGQMRRAGELLQIAAEQSPPEWGDVTTERQADWQRFRESGTKPVPVPGGIPTPEQTSTSPSTLAATATVHP
ncbi:MAG TPA: tetratricopeptide repeat protein [Candidatus Ozemobacteraceae bacterium]|nr:tetratricopeptide repeat protein [Candidatus Ozemobacteraceae bacterium]